MTMELFFLILNIHGSFDHAFQSQSAFKMTSFKHSADTKNANQISHTTVFIFIAIGSCLELSISDNLHLLV